MYILSEKSIPLVKYMLERYDMYHITNFPIVAALQDGGCVGKDPINLSAQWLYDRHGLNTSLPQYDTQLKRITEFTYHGDYLKTLRQRINIVNELIDCNLDSNLPVHVSCKPKSDKKITLDLESKDSLSNLHFICHPGQTRIQGSIFLRDPLKNILFYIKKDFSKNIDVKEYPYIKKVNNVDDLIKCYRPYIKNKNDSYYYDFFMPSFDKGLKYHGFTESYILKANNIAALPNKKMHSSFFYLLNTFISMNKFSSILFNNKLNIYTNNINKAKEIVDNSQNTILSSFLSKENYQNFLNLTKINKVSEPWGYESCNNYNYTFESNKSYFKQNLTDEEYDFFIKFENLLNDKNSKVKNTLNLNFIENKSLSNFNEIVNYNNKKGICFVLDTDKVKTFNRDLYELLFCIPAKFSVSCNKEKSIAVINCEHKGWQNKKDYKQYTFTKEFFK